jgi:hypothetical protein
VNGKPWSFDDLRQLAELYPDRPTKQIAQKLGRPIASVYNAAFKHGLKKSQKFLDTDPSCRLRKGHTRGRESQFKKGQTPANKGLRRPGYSVGRGRMQQTQFKKGQRTGVAARNWRPIGTILPDPEGYLRIKVREAVHGKEATGFGNMKVWPQLNRHVWEQHKGPIPPKHIVAFKDGNRANCAIDNLELMSMADNARRNAMWATLPRDLAEAIQLNGALKRKVRRLYGEKQDQRPAGSPVRDPRSVEGRRKTDGH